MMTGRSPPSFGSQRHLGLALSTFDAMNDPG